MVNLRGTKGQISLTVTTAAGYNKLCCDVKITVKLVKRFRIVFYFSRERAVAR